MKKRSSLLGWGGFVLAVAALGGCGKQQEPAKMMGQPLSGVAKLDTIGAAQHSGATKLVTVHGVMTDKCPMAGCWFHLRDHSGTIKVDTKAAGFTVVNVPLQTEMTVSGTLVADGGEKMIRAASVRY